MNQDDFKTLRDAQQMMVEKQIKVDDNHITAYIKAAIEMVDARGESLNDYALIKVQNPMTLKDNNSVTITSQWRIIHVSKLDNVPVYDD